MICCELYSNGHAILEMFSNIINKHQLRHPRTRK